MHHTLFVVVFKSDVLLLDWSNFFPSRSDGSAQGNGQLFTDHIQYVEIRASGRRLQIGTGSPSKLKDFEGVVDDHAWRGALPQYDPVSELLQLRRILAGAAEGLRFRYGRCLRLNRSPTCLEHTLLTGIANLFGIDLAPFIQWREHLL